VFTDRKDAGKRLLERLPPLDPENTVVLALPRGGLPVADVIADALDVPLDIALVRKIGFPGQPEFALGAVTDGDVPQITVNTDVAQRAGIGDAKIRELAELELPELNRRRQTYLKGRASIPLAGKVVVVVDDGIATGATMRAALRLVRAMAPKRVIAAVPVGPPDTIAEIKRECDEVICLESPPTFSAVGQHYRLFDQVTDATVIGILDRHSDCPIRVQCREGAGAGLDRDEHIPFAIAVTLQLAASARYDVHEEIEDIVRVRLRDRTS
jgi:putative phosphoribosyl transferase